MQNNCPFSVIHTIGNDIFQLRSEMLDPAQEAHDLAQEAERLDI